MKLLLDENLSRRLVPFLQHDYPGSTQVALTLIEPVRIPRDGGHGSMLMADSVPPSSRTPFHGDGGQHSILKADTPAVF
jgi:hypothetical protein